MKPLSIWVKRAFFAIAAPGFLAACALHQQSPSTVSFSLDPAIVPAEETDHPLIYDLRVDPRFADFADQVLEQSYALLGREDLAARSSNEYEPSACRAHPSGLAGEDALLDEIARQAASTRIVIINESHTVSRHRGFSRRVVERLREYGFTHFAAESFAHPSEATAPVEEGMALAYPRDIEGHYIKEAGFGRLWRTARDLGYVPVAYEQNTPHDGSVPRDEQIAAREAFQAEALAEAIEQAGPDARFVIHVGYAHASEHEGELGPVWMAGRLKELTGIDPLTVSQFQCRQDSGTVRLAEGDHDGSGLQFDLVLDHPVTRFVSHRPVWRREAGDILVPVPPALMPTGGAHVIEARLVDEPDDAIPMDRVLVFPGEDVALMLPPGHYRLRAVIAVTQGDT